MAGILCMSSQAVISFCCFVSFYCAFFCSLQFWVIFASPSRLVFSVHPTFLYFLFLFLAECSLLLAFSIAFENQSWMCACKRVRERERKSARAFGATRQIQNQLINIFYVFFFLIFANECAERCERVLIGYRCAWVRNICYSNYAPLFWDLKRKRSEKNNLWEASEYASHRDISSARENLEPIIFCIVRHSTRS